MRRTKIVCIIGPASSSEERLEQLMRAGMNVARLNFSHGTQHDHAVVIERLRSISKRLGCSIAVLQGPKIRLDGTDAIMLSAETGSGAYPIEAVEMMAHIALETEAGNGRLVLTCLGVLPADFTVLPILGRHHSAVYSVIPALSTELSRPCKDDAAVKVKPPWRSYDHPLLGA